ncbi:MAG: DUF4256 domain-containing protein [Myxococcaceae bacterium]|jgi:hypothetical protein|nr:DUF4256 domain-containing protein [Myxococcaceae bacterium]MCA3012186.1 DUF4256 domain-containing protein [Myxococcaceae bacterium]
MTKTATSRRQLGAAERRALLETLEARFTAHPERHPDLDFGHVAARLEASPSKLWSVAELERTGGEPDVIGADAKTGELVLCDCAPETPKGRRSVCYDDAALEARKENKPKASALGLAAAMGVEVLDEEGYRALQCLGPFDQKTSSWLLTPPGVRALGGALFGDHRFGRVFTYHNGAESYYAARAFRARLRV